ncbi:quinone oxidoreductase [uncultured Roseobacter sp.]|uniref:quinone oxidoreductase family protein n=1 Tax=uncultured Roseobacter sp. TaxID=114847 RepID=UPI002610086A|nr:quinone oxidoreductase [uncultured Roseobacter sp.]
MAYAIAAQTPGDRDVLNKIHLDVPSPRAGQVLLKQTAVGVNFLDIYFRSGLYPWPVESDLVLGSEAAGVIEAVGPGVDGFNVGDRVAYTMPNNAYVSHRVIDAAQLVTLPDEVTDAQAAASVLKGLTAYYLIHDSFTPKAGDTVLFHAAAGGVGLLAGQWLAEKGVTTIGTAGGPEKCAIAKTTGRYTHVIDYKSENFAERVSEITGGQGVDAVYDSIAKDTYPGSLNCLKMFGTLVLFGQASGPADDFKIADLAAGSFRLTRPILYHFTQDKKWLNDASRSLFEMIASGKISVAINQELPLDQAQKAHELLENRLTTGCTILLP